MPSGKQAGLEIRLKEDHEDLHLIVDEKRFDIATFSDNPRNLMRQVVSGKKTFLVRVVNVARDAVTTQDKRPYSLELRLKKVDYCESQDENKTEQASGESSLYFSGLFTDGGKLCTPLIDGYFLFSKNKFVLEMPELETFLGASHFINLVHDGAGGWQPNAGGTLALQLDGLEYDDLQLEKAFSVTGYLNYNRWEGKRVVNDLYSFIDGTRNIISSPGMGGMGAVELKGTMTLTSRTSILIRGFEAVALTAKFELSGQAEFVTIFSSVKTDSQGNLFQDNQPNDFVVDNLQVTGEFTAPCLLACDGVR